LPAANEANLQELRQAWAGAVLARIFMRCPWLDSLTIELTRIEVPGTRVRLPSASHRRGQDFPVEDRHWDAHPRGPHIPRQPGRPERLGSAGCRIEQRRYDAVRHSEGRTASDTRAG
jgi:hypothetical protein